MKNKGFTLLELMIAIAILAILISMLGPLFSSITKANKKSTELTRLDLTLGRTIDVFKRTIRSSKDYSTGTFGGNTSGVAIYISDLNGQIDTGVTSGVAIVANVPKIEGGTLKEDKVIFYYDSTNKKLMINSTESKLGNFSGVTNPTTLVTGVENAHFEYKENIAIIELKVKVGDTEKIIREAAVTRINIQF